VKKLILLLLFTFSFLVNPDFALAQAAPYIDLAVISVDYDADRFGTITIKNAGNKELYPATSSVEIKYSPRGENVTIALSQFSTGYRIGAGQTGTYKMTNPAPDEATGFSATINPDHAVNEGPNYYANTITGSLPDKKLPNYLITDVVFSSDRKPTITLKNDGTGTANPLVGVVALNYADSHSNMTTSETINLKDFSTGNKIDPGQSGTFTSSKEAPDYSLLYATNISGVKEVKGGDSNNYKKGPVPEKQFADLSITDVSFNDNKQPTITIINNGLAAADISAGDLRTIYKGERETAAGSDLISLSLFNAGRLNPKQTSTITAPKKAPGNALSYTFVINDNGAIKEGPTGSGNNKKEGSVTISKKPDLIIDSVTVPSSGTVKMVLKNIGNAPATLRKGNQTTAVEYTLLDKNKQYITSAAWYTGVDTLNPGQTVSDQLSFDYNKYGYADDYKAVADANNIVAESVEDNNEYFHVKLAANYTVKEATISAMNNTVLALKEATPSGFVLIGSNLANIDAGPCDPLYAVKSLGRTIESAFTFGDEAKAKLNLSNANKKTVEAAQVSNSDKKDRDKCAATALTEAAKDVAKANSLIDKISTKAPDKAQGLALQAVTTQLSQQKIITGVINTSKSNDDTTKLLEVQDKSLNNLAKSVEKVTDNAKLQAALKPVDKDDADPLSPVSNLAVLTSLEGKLTDNKKEQVTKAKDETTKQIQEIAAALPDDKKSLVTDYTNAVSGKKNATEKTGDQIVSGPTATPTPQGKIVPPSAPPTPTPSSQARIVPPPIPASSSPSPTATPQSGLSKPDLTIVSANVDAQRVLTAVVKNLGNAPAPLGGAPNHTMDLRLDLYDASSQWLAGPAHIMTGADIAPGASVTYTLKLSDLVTDPTKFDKTRKLSLSVDDRDVLVESKEDNNRMDGVAVPEPPRADLTIVSADVDAQRVLTAVVKNLGNAPAPLGGQPNHTMDLRWDLYDSSNQWLAGPSHVMTGADITPGASVTYTVKLADLTAVSKLDKARKLRLTVDDRNVLVESNEDNNFIEKVDVPEPPRPDLTITSANVDGQRVLTAVVKNLGDAPAPLGGEPNHTMDLRLDVYDANRQWLAGPSHIMTGADIAGGASVTYTLKLTDLVTDMIKLDNASWLRLTVDDRDVLVESNEDNNFIEKVDIPEVSSASPTPNALLTNPPTVEALISTEVRLVSELKEATVSSPVAVASGISDFNALPCEPLYVVKSAGRAIESLFTFGDENKAKLAIENADEKTAEAVLLSSKDKPDCAIDTLADAIKDLEVSNELIDKIAKKDPEKASEIAEISLEEQLKQQQAAGVVIKDSTGENLVEVKRIRNESLDILAKVMDKVTDTVTLEEVLTMGPQEQDPLISVTNLEVLMALADKVQSEDKQSAIDQAIGNNLTKVTEVLTVIPDDQKGVFVDYVQGAGGDETNKIKLLDAIRLEGVDSVSKAALVDAKEEVVDDFRLKIKEIPEKDNKSQLEAMSDLTDGSTEDLRVLAELTKGLDNDLDVVSVDPVTEESAGNFAEEVKKMDPGQKKEVAADIAEEFDDLNQVIVYDDLVDTVKDEGDKQVFEELGDTLKEEIKDNLESSGAKESSQSAEAKEEFLDTFSDRSPEDMDALKDHADFLDKGTYQVLVESQLTLLKDEIGNEEDDYKDYSKVFEDAEYKKFLDSQGSEVDKLGKYFEDFDWQNEGEDKPDQEQEERAKEATTPKCDDKNEPVCGSDGQTYDNKCKFEEETKDQEGEKIDIAHDGVCKEGDAVLGASTYKAQLSDYALPIIIFLYIH
jgi:hypothetical protein